MRLSNKRVMYGSDSGHVGLANTINGKDIFGQQVRRINYPPFPSLSPPTPTTVSFGSDPQPCLPISLMPHINGI